MQKILIIGQGGREHALAHKVAASANVAQVFVAPGNGGTANENKVTNIAIAAEKQQQLLEFAIKEQIDLTIVGPEAPLVAGIVDLFHSKGLAIYGPNKVAAALEGSKTFSKDFLAKHNIPTAKYASFSCQKQALAYLEEHSLPVVIKADGLAAGKGVIIAHSKQQAINAVNDMLAENVFGAAGSRVVIEEFLHGEEASFIVMCDGKHALALASSQDHKARDDNDLGPNTGGMGAYSPAPVVDQQMHNKIMQQVIEPTLKAMAQHHSPYVGFLYAGLMIGNDGSIKVLEFNCRLGDPEAQVILMRLESDLVKLCQLAFEQKLNTAVLNWRQQTALGIVIAAEGYPFEYQKGAKINNLHQADNANCKVFHAGSKQLPNGDIITNGGRVLCVVALGNSPYQAQQIALKNAAKISFKGAFYRRDIGHRAIGRQHHQ